VVKVQNQRWETVRSGVGPVRL